MKNIILLVLCLSAIVGCGDNGSGSNAGSQEMSARDSGAQVHFMRNQETLAKLNYGDTTIISVDGVYLQRKRSSSGKIKYLDGQGATVAKIKRSEGKIKLKTADGTLLWKVKKKEASIKIADNEEMYRAFKIKRKEDGRYKLYINEDEVGKATVVGDRAEVKRVEAKYTVDGDLGGIAGIIGFSEIPVEMRLVIIAELAQ